MSFSAHSLSTSRTLDVSSVRKRYGVGYVQKEYLMDSERKAAHQRALWNDRESTTPAQEREEGVGVLKVVDTPLRQR